MNDLKAKIKDKPTAARTKQLEASKSAWRELNVEVNEATKAASAAKEALRNAKDSLRKSKALVKSLEKFDTDWAKSEKKREAEKAKKAKAKAKALKAAKAAERGRGRPKKAAKEG